MVRLVILGSQENSGELLLTRCARLRERTAVRWRARSLDAIARGVDPEAGAAPTLRAHALGLGHRCLVEQRSNLPRRELSHPTPEGRARKRAQVVEVHDVFRTPPVEWISDRVSKLQDVLEQRTVRSAQALREILGPIRMGLVTPDIGRPFYRAITSIDALALTESPPAGAEGGSNSLQRWRRRVRKARNSPSPSGDSAAAGGRVVAEPIVCGRRLVAVCSECEVESGLGPVLRRDASKAS